MDQSEFNILVSMDDCSQTVEKKRRQKMMSYVVSFLRIRKKKLFTFEAIYTERAQQCVLPPFFG